MSCLFFEFNKHIGSSILYLNIKIEPKPMLSTVFGDLFDYAAPGDMIVQGVNCQGKMASGFAAQLRKRHPVVYLEYAQLYREEGLKLGDYLAVYDQQYCIFNALTQEYYGRDKAVVYVDYKALEKTMRAAAQMAKRLKMRVWMPFIGAGLANGDPSVVYSILKRSYACVEASLVLPVGYDTTQFKPPLIGTTHDQ